MRKLSVILIILLFITCKDSNGSKDDSESILMNLGLGLFRNTRISISGTAVKGIVRNATVTVHPLKDGACDTSTVLITQTTDESGNYSMTYFKTGSVVCLSVTTNSNGKTTLFDEKTNSDVAVPATSSFKLVTIIPESKIIENSRKNAMISPFSKLLARRLEYLIKQAGSGADVNGLHKKASKEIVIRFGLQSGLSVASGKSILNPGIISPNILDSNYLELDDILLQLENPSSPLTAKFISILVGFSQLANKYKKGETVSIDDIDAIIEAFAVDFEDGIFDGKGINGLPITLGTGADQITFSSTPLTTILLPAVASYFQEGGKLSVGRSTISPVPVITAAQITSQVQFVDSTSIISGDTVALSLTYPGNPFTFGQNNAITTITPIATGTITSCSSSPALPTGLSLSATCVISGTPTVLQGSTNYTITATNATGSANVVISISVIVLPAAPSSLSYPLRALPFIVGVPVGTLTPSVTGTVTTYSVSPALPTGVSINSSTGVISGTPSGTFGSTPFTITASNAGGSTTANVTYSVVANHPNIYLFYKGSQDGDISGAGGGSAICTTYRNSNLPFLHCNGIRAFLSTSGDDLVNAPTTNSFNGSRPVYGVNESTQGVTQLTASWGALWNLGTTPLMSTFTTSMNFASGYYFTFTQANGTYDATNNCTNGTTNNSGINGTAGRSDQTGTGAVNWTAYPCYAYSLVCVCY